MSRVRVVAGLVAIGAVVAAAGGAANAAFPGRSGRIVFASERFDPVPQLFSVAPNGAGLRHLTRSPPFAFEPHFSPDGSRVAFVVSEPLTAEFDIWIARADGTGRHPLVRRLTMLGFGYDLSWSPDGRQIAYCAFTAGSDSDVWAVNVAGGRPRQLTATKDSDLRPTWSPDGREIAFEREFKSVYVVPAQGGEAREIGAGQQAAWSPDGSELAVVRDKKEIWLVARDGSVARHLVAGTEPAWSPDGASIAFGRPDGLYVVRPDGGAPRLVTRGGAELPAWSRDGRWIAFASSSPGAPAVDVVRPDGSGRRRLFPFAPGLRRLFPNAADRREFLAFSQVVGRPAWSRDRRRIVIGLDNFDFNYQMLFAVRIDRSVGGSFFGAAPANDGGPAWSPDGRAIAFDRNNGVLYVARADGSGVRRLADGWDPSWSPDGKRIVVETPVDCARIVTVATGRSRQILCNAAQSGISPEWSPDGRWIAYVGAPADEQDVGGPITLYSLATRRSRSLGVETIGWLDWSPDGKRLAYTDSVGITKLRFDVYVLDVARRRRHLLARDAAQPAWSPDGKEIVFVRGYFGRNAELFVANADGSRVRRVTYNTGPDLSPDWH